MLLRLRGVSRNTPRKQRPQIEMRRNNQITKVLQNRMESMNMNPMTMEIANELKITFQLFLISATRC